MNNKSLTFRTATYLLAVLLVFIWSCNRENSFKEIRVKSYTLKEPVYLYRLDTTGYIPVDSLVKQSTSDFSFIVNDSIEYVYKVVQGQKFVAFIPGNVKNTEIDLSGKNTTHITKSNATSITGFYDYLADLEKQADSLRQVFRTAQVSDSFQVIREQINEALYALLDSALIKGEHFIKGNPGSIGVFSVINSALSGRLIFNYKASPDIFLFADSVMQNHNPVHPYTVALHNRVNYLRKYYGTRSEVLIDENKRVTFPELEYFNLNKQPQPVLIDKEFTLVFLWDDSPASLASLNDAARILSEFNAKGFGNYAIADISDQQKRSSLIQLKKLWTNNLTCSKESFSLLLKHIEVTKLPYFIIVNKSRQVTVKFSSSILLDKWFERNINQKESKNK